MRRTSHKRSTMRRTKYSSGLKSNSIMKKPLGERDIQELVFAKEYLTDFDPIGAALRAGMISMRLTGKQQETEAHRILNCNSVQGYIREAIQDRMLRVGITEDKLLCQLNNIASFDVLQLRDGNGDFKVLEDIDPDARKCIQELTVRTQYKKVNGEKVPVAHITQIKLSNKLDAIKTLLGHFKAESDNKLAINYNQYNIDQRSSVAPNAIPRQIDMSDFTELELRVIKKMTGEQDPHEFLKLQEIEKACYAPVPS